MSCTHSCRHPIRNLCPPSSPWHPFSAVTRNLEDFAVANVHLVLLRDQQAVRGLEELKVGHHWRFPGAGDAIVANELGSVGLAGRLVEASESVATRAFADEFDLSPLPLAAVRKGSYDRSHWVMIG